MAGARASEHKVAAPGGGPAIVISDQQGLSFRVEIDGKAVVSQSPLGLEFQDGAKLGPAAVITKTARAAHDGTWQNPLGNNRFVRDNWRELRLTLEERGTPRRVFGLVVRAYPDGVAFRYDLPEASGLGKFVLTKELTEFRFGDDYRCWAGRESGAAEAPYPETKLSAIPATGRNGQPYKSVLPLLVQTPAGYVAVAESDLLDWAGMSITGSGGPAVKVTLDGRADGNGLVQSAAPRLSPWRVLMFGRTPVELAGSDLIATLATPNRLKDVSWIRPGASAWDPWWTGRNPYDPDPRHENVEARGSTRADKEYIDLASDMGWPYQLADWYWYKNMTSYNKSLHSKPNDALADFTVVDPQIDIPELVEYAKTKHVRMLIWAHSLDVETFGVEKTLAYLAKLGFAGVKIDFFNSQAQETVVWCQKVLETAAKYHLLINFHGTYKPTGLARTYPNFITQEGVLGNEYNKLGGKRVTPLHKATLPFTRALLGPMDFTPGGFVNRTPQEFKTTVPAETIGTRANELALAVAYPSPLVVFCDSPRNYRDQPGLEFLRAIPTVWDESVTLSGEVGKSFVVARRSGERWYLVALNGEGAAKVDAPLKFLQKGQWSMRSFADNTDSSDYRAVVESTREVTAETVVPLSMLPGGGFAAILSTAQRVLAPTPPMGWNSWDSHGLRISEQQFRENVEALARKLKPSGYDYAVIDEGWYMHNPEDRPKPELLKYAVDANGRFIPVGSRFPSAVRSGKNTGFTEIGKWIHSQGLKFGVHLVRGIPREAVKINAPIENSNFKAADAADQTDACPWDPTSWGVKNNEAGQAWYDSLLRQLAGWGVDFLKVDCISDHPYKGDEIRQIQKAIEHSGRDIVLSLSPGPTQLSHQAEVAELSQMWRISNDIWDVWSGRNFPIGIKEQFENAAKWAQYAKPGNWPDADMLPVGELRPWPDVGPGPRHTRLTPVEQQTHLTLWAMARSPLIVGSNMVLMDDKTVRLLTNPDMLRIDQTATASRQVLADGDLIVWTADLPGSQRALAVFNIGDAPLTVDRPLAELGLPAGETALRNAWTAERLPPGARLKATIEPHGCLLLMPDAR